MAEVLVEFDTVLTAPDGSRWVPRACGGVAGDGLWQGWLEFLPMETSRQPRRTTRETEQPNRDDLVYWAEGLTDVYLDGALARALGGAPEAAPAEGVVHPHYDAPAERPIVREPLRVLPRPVLNPFAAYQQGEDVLMQELGALAPGRLRDIVTAYGFAEPAAVDGADREALVSLIIAGVRRPAVGRHWPVDPEASV